MSLTSHFSCVSGYFSLYYVYFFWVYCNFYHPTKKILDDESDDDGSDSRSAGTCAFPFRFEESVGHVDDSVGNVDGSFCRVCVVGFGVFVPILIKSMGDIVLLVVLLTIGVESKGGRLIKIFWRPKP